MVRKWVGVVVGMAALLGILVIAGGGASGTRQAAAQPSDDVRCSAPFEATAYNGADAGFSLRGMLNFEFDRFGAARGQVLRSDGSTVDVVGQVVGRSITMVFDLGDRGVIVGIGGGVNAVSECRGFIGGTFSGPGAGSSGDWAYICLNRRFTDC